MLAADCVMRAAASPFCVIARSASARPALLLAPRHTRSTSPPSRRFPPPARPSRPSAGSGRPQRPPLTAAGVRHPWADLRPQRRPQLVRAAAPAILIPAGSGIRVP